MSKVRSQSARALPVLWVCAMVFSAIGVAVAMQPLPTTRTDFFEPGRQPVQLTNGLVDATNCSFCHGDYDEVNAPYDTWSSSLMAQSARDPVFYAALAIAEQDAAFVGDSCLRCHAPVGWLRGHADLTSGANLANDDFQGVSCSVCHRMVDPIYAPGVSPEVDLGELNGLTTAIPTEPHNGAYVIDTKDRRRGPFDLDADWASSGGFPFHDWRESPFHQSSRLCATCHDVSLAHYTKQVDGSFALNAYNTPGPSKHEQFPEQRTYSEWAGSLFAQGPVNLAGRFGGTRPTVSSCQDCHMPGALAEGCGIGDVPTRPQMPRHTFNGANSWVLRAVRELYFDSETGLSETSVDQAVQRNAGMLAAASDLELSKLGPELNARVINFSGHKLPTGYVEGRRVWVNVKFFSASDVVVQELGRYDDASATLVGGGADTKVYEAVHGLDAAAAAATGLTEGPAFRLALVNTKFKDNRIPPMGFTNAAYAATGAAPVPTGLYPDGQYWDDTLFTIPLGATRAEVRVLHQTSTREYMEFLRDANTTNTAGQVAFDLWTQFGRSAPVEMDFAAITFATCPGDYDGSGAVDLLDLLAFLNDWSARLGQAVAVGGPGDVMADGVVDLLDLLSFLSDWVSNLGLACN